MECNRENGRLTVACMDEYGPLPGCRICLLDARGKELCRAFTECCGSAELPVAKAELYQVRVQADACHSPGAQNRWFRLSPEKNWQCCFFFNRPLRSAGAGKLKITLRDAYYPEYTLSKGVYTLWRIS